jgi:hypothetical protein
MKRNTIRTQESVAITLSKKMIHLVEDAGWEIDKKELEEAVKTNAKNKYRGKNKEEKQQSQDNNK